MEFKKWNDYIRDLEIPHIEKLSKDELVNLVFEYEQTLSSIANIDAQFIDSHGDGDYTDKEALDRIAEMVDPIWNRVVERKLKR